MLESHSSCTVILDPLYFCWGTLQRPRISRASFVDKLISNAGTLGDFRAKAGENGDHGAG